MREVVNIEKSEHERAFEGKVLKKEIGKGKVHM